MDPKLLKQVVAKVHRRYPEFAGCQPKVRKQPTSHGAPAGNLPTYLLTFKGAAIVKSAAGDKSLSRYLRIVVDAEGNILKESTSR